MGIVYGDSINEAIDNLTLKYTEESIIEATLSSIKDTWHGVLTFDQNMLLLLNYLTEEE